MGTRPEAIKLAPVVAALRRSTDFRCTVVATGQHKEMFWQVTETFGFEVDADLDVMQPNQTLAGLTARLMEGIDRWLGSAQPDLGPGSGRHDDSPGRGPGLLLSPDSHRARRGRPADRKHLVALPRGGQPPAGDPAHGAALRTDRDGARRLAAGRDLRGGNHRDRQHGHRRSSDGGGHPAQPGAGTGSHRARDGRAHRPGTGIGSPSFSSPVIAGRTSVTASPRSASPSPPWPAGSPTTASSTRSISTPTCTST